jgi:hypothetical protein
MDYFQGVVAEYLRADRACFINPEFWVRGNLSKPMNSPHWFVDVLAVHMKHRRIYLCEVTYAKKAPALIKRLQSWRTHWATIRQTIVEDTAVAADWSIIPWIFTPVNIRKEIEKQVLELHPNSRFTDLEMVMPWLYRTWDRIDDEPPELLTHPI